MFNAATSFTTTAILTSPAFSTIRFSNVVFPAPRKPESRVTGTGKEGIVRDLGMIVVGSWKRINLWRVAAWVTLILRVVGLANGRGENAFSQLIPQRTSDTTLQARGL